MDTDKISRSSLVKTIEEEQAQWDQNTESHAAKWDECETILALIDRAEPAPDWTPCSEKQPESDGVYYVTVTFNGKSVTRDQVFHEGKWLPLGKLMVNGVSGEPEVIAWMEKPAPYHAPLLDFQQSGFGRA